MSNAQIVAGLHQGEGMQKDNLVSQIAEAIHEKIRTGEYPPGTRLRQEMLAAEFSVSRTPIREALRQLEITGLVRHLPNQGAAVRSPTAREIREVYQVRAELEGLAASLAAQWINDAQVDELKAAEVKFVKVVDVLAKRKSRSGIDPTVAKGVPSWVEANDEFHRVIMDAAGNRRLHQVVYDMHVGFTRNVMLSALLVDGSRMREYVAQHEAILSAIARHDPDEARRVMVHHVLRSGELVVRWLEQQDEVAGD